MCGNRTDETGDMTRDPSLVGPHVCVYVKSRSIFTEICIRWRRASYLTRAKIEFSRATVQYCISSRSARTFSLPASSCTRDTVCQLLCRHRNTTPGAVLAGALTDTSSLPDPSPSGPHEQDSERESGLWQRRSSASVLILRAHGRARLESGRRVSSSVTAAAVAYPTQCRT